MKTHTANLRLLPVLLSVLGLILTDRLAAQTFTTLHSFTELVGILGTNTDGGPPVGGLTLSGNTLFGIANSGSGSGNGTVFKLSADGTDFTTLYSFPSTSGTDFFTNVEGAKPIAGVILSRNTLYGTSSSGGNGGVGTVFTVNTT